MNELLKTEIWSGDYSLLDCLMRITLLWEILLKTGIQPWSKRGWKYCLIRPFIGFNDKDLSLREIGYAGIRILPSLEMTSTPWVNNNLTRG
jgi:hypothetical protein